MSDTRTWNVPSMYVGGDKERMGTTEVVSLSDHLAALQACERRVRSEGADDE